MKKRIISIFLVLAMLASMMVMPTYAAEKTAENTTNIGEVCPCGCGNKLDAVKWTPWNVAGIEGPTSGHYYLDGDYIQDGQKQIMAGDHVVLDLRGNSITSKSYSRLLLVYGQMHVLDTVGGGRFMSKTSGGAFGGVVMVSTNEVNDTLFALHSGTVTQDADNKGSRRGGLVHLSETATFRMTGGVLLNGSTVIPGDTYKEPGGCVAGNSAKCTVEILGGQVIGGESATHGGNIYCIGTTILKNCEIIGGVAKKSGGNIFQNGGMITIENCRITDGEAHDTSSGGGNIGLSSGAALTVKDSTLHNGYSNYHGGNLYIGNGSAVIENTQITAGVARTRGNNVYGSTSATAMTLRDCELPGDIAYVGKGLTLEGKVKIGLLNHGLRLNFSSDYAEMADADGLTEGSEIYVVAKHTFAAPGADPSFFKGAIRTRIAQSEEGLVATYATSGEEGGCCPHCNEIVAWEVFSLTGSLKETCLNDSSTDTNSACTGRHMESGHYYLGETQTSFAQYYAGASYDPEAFVDVVIDTAGYSLTGTGRIFYVRTVSGSTGQSSLTILDSHGGSNITGQGAANQPGGVIYNESSKLTIYDGNYKYKPVSGRNVTGGGVILNGDSLTVHGGIFDGSQFAYTDQSTADKTYTYNGAALYQYNGSKYDFTMTAGRFIGGRAQSGGCAYFGGNNVVNITGGQFVGGVADSAAGGNIRIYGSSDYTKAKFNMSGASIRDGRIEVTGAGGGNMSLSYGTINIADSYIEGGYAAAYGGNIMVGTTANITVSNCVIEGGYAAGQSGNVHLSSTGTTTTWTDCSFLNGSATYGGNLTSGNGYNTFYGGQILFGTARTSYGGNLAALSGNASATSKNYTRLTVDDAGYAPLLAGGSAKTYGGNLYVGGVTDLQAAKIVGGKAATLGQDMYVTKGSNQSKLTVGAGVTGDISIGFATALLGSEVYGQVIDRTECTQLNATMILDGDYNDAVLCAKDGQLFVGAIAVTDGNHYTWFTDAASAVEACDADHYVKLFIAQDVVLTKDCAVDICGQNVNISGAYTLYGMDSSGDGYTAPTGRAILAEETKLATDTAAGGKRYVASQDASGVMFHRLENRISGVTLRPSADGIYFTGAFGCDETLLADIASYGVAVSTVNMPGLDFMTDEDTLYTTFDAATLVGGAKKSGVLINGIMKDSRGSDLNSAYGQMPVFAASYLVMKDGTVILGENQVAYSLRDVMTEVDDRICEDPLNYRVFTNPMRDFYAKWEEGGMADWSFKKIIPPQEDDVLNILMIGSSGCYYYVEELYGLLTAAGIKANVCNVYYSGGKLYQHYTWWVNKESNYEFFCTNENGRKKTAGVSLEWCLAQQEWDAISLQESGTGVLRTTSLEKVLADRELYLTELYGYLKDQFPKASFYWHENTAYQVGYTRDFLVESIEDQRKDTENFRNMAIAISEKYDVVWIPRGEGKMLVREGGYDQLCARLGKGDNHEGDYYHAGDIGGGQYLTGCVWFETLTGLSCIGNPYRPVYTYNGVVMELNEGITYEQLQQYAHQAVEGMWETMEK
ncbi:MAG: DUF4886 domain-containing protein [Oscillospiraceae bacterium]|nr:DUF4886 domain-containing protein [Oscillospiraceae bacterium]